MPSTPVLGVFVGGASRRMGGRPKGWLRAPDTGEPLLARLLRLGREAGLAPCVVGDASAYVELAGEVPQVVDQPAGIGPLGGLGGLLAHASGALCVVVACDMPHVTAELLARLAARPSEAAVVAPRTRDGQRWQPLFARYRPAKVAPALRAALEARERSWQALLRRVEVEPFGLSHEETALLDDWDRPQDIIR